MRDIVRALLTNYRMMCEQVKLEKQVIFTRMFLQKKVYQNEIETSAE